MLEHENLPRKFYEEIRKLLSVRTPLKVGITYALNEQGNYQRIPDRIRATVKEEFHKINGLIGEDPRTEYLFLIGLETARNGRRKSPQH